MSARPIFINLLLATFWILFAISNILSYLTTGAVTYLIFLLLQSELIIFFVIRTPVSEITVGNKDRITALIGTFAVLLYRPSIHHIDPVMSLIGDLFIYLAALFELFGVLSLNRSFGIYAAKRQIKTGGLYRLVRHPIYLGSFFLFIGYVIRNASFLNVVVLIISAGCQLLRIQAEERLLMRSPEYVAYAKRVKYRLIPGLF